MVLGALLALLAAALTPMLALAAPKTWTGGGSNANWTTPANWVGGAPVAGDDLIFPQAATQFTNTNDFPPGTTFNSIVILASGYTLNGNAVTIAAGQQVAAAYLSGSSTINLPISGSGTTINVINPGSTLVFGGSLTNLGNFAKDGTGTAVLLAPGTTATGSGWNVKTGILNVQNGAALGIHFVDVQPGATLQVQGGVTLLNNIGLIGSVGATNTTGALESVSGNNTLTGVMDFFDDTTVSADAGATLNLTNSVESLNLPKTLTVNALGAVAISGVVSGPAGTALRKTGPGTLFLSADNTYPGPTTVSAGTLLINGSQPASSVIVNSGATLGGTGTTGPVTTTGVVSPGVGAPGILQSGNATFNLGSTLAVDLNGPTVGSGYDQLVVAGTVTLTAPTLTVSVGFPSATGNAYAILRGLTALSGTFAGLPEGATFVSGGRIFRINYTTNLATLTDIGPAPTATSTPTPTPTVTPTPTPARIPGDFNGDGFVDIRDYGVWRQNFGQTNCGNPADANGDCLVDIRDYGIWRLHFGEGTPPDRRSSPVRADTAPAPRGTPGPALLGSDQAVTGNWAPHQPNDAGPAVPIVPLVGGLLGLGGLAGWRRRRPPGRE